MNYDCKMRQFSINNQMSQKLATLGHRTIFNDAQHPNGLANYKKPQMTNVKQFKREY